MCPTIGYEPGKAWAGAELLGLLLRCCVTEFGQAGVMVAHDPVAPAFSRPDSRWPADGGRQATPQQPGLGPPPRHRCPPIPDTATEHESR